jgi:hypothetical protein
MAPGRHTIRFEIGRGTGQTLARLPALLLPTSVDSAKYEAAVRDYVTDSTRLVEDSVPLILESLADVENRPN